MIDPRSSPPPLPPYIVLFGPRGNCTLELCPVVYSVYGYRPSPAANGTFIALFVLAGMIHIYQGIRYKTWFVVTTVTIGCISGILGYIGRLMLYNNPFQFSAFMLQMICVTSVPLYFCAAIYVTLAQTIEELAPELSRFRPRILYWFFIPIDLTSLVIQAIGGALTTVYEGNSKAGIYVALTGLALQVLTICIFCGLMVDYMRRYATSIGRERRLALRVKQFFVFLSAAIFLITVRCIYRLVELNQGYNGKLARDEGLFIAFEGAFVLAAAFALAIGHPGRVFGRATVVEHESPSVSVKLQDLRLLGHRA